MWILTQYGRSILYLMGSVWTKPVSGGRCIIKTGECLLGTYESEGRAKEIVKEIFAICGDCTAAKAYEMPED